MNSSNRIGAEFWNNFDLLIHNGSTSSLQASLRCLPTIYLVPEGLNELQQIENDVSPLLPSPIPSGYRITPSELRMCDLLDILSIAGDTERIKQCYAFARHFFYPHNDIHNQMLGVGEGINPARRIALDIRKTLYSTVLLVMLHIWYSCWNA